MQGIVRGIAQCTYYLGQAALEAIDLSILAVSDQSSAHKKLQIWKQKFTQLVDTMSEQWQVTPSHDITKIVSRFATEVLLTGKVFRALGGLFSFARMNSTKLIGKAQKVTESVSRVTTPEGITTYINKAVKHTQATSKTGHSAKHVLIKLRKIRRPIQERFEQRLQFRQSTGRMSKQSATELRKTKPKPTKEFVQQRRSYQPAKDEPTVKVSSSTELTKPKTVKKLGKKGKPPPPMKTYEGNLNNNNLQSNIIKEFNNIEKMKKHIFSPEHIKRGIFNLGKNEDNILDKFVNIVKLADHKNLLEAGPNQIHTIINNRKVVIRTFIRENKILRINGFIEDNVNYVGNVFELLVKEYHYG